MINETVTRTERQTDGKEGDMQWMHFIRHEVTWERGGVKFVPLASTRSPPPLPPVLIFSLLNFGVIQLSNYYFSALVISFYSTLSNYPVSN